MQFPFVVKVGNHHGGYGKSLVSTEEQWEELKDLLFIHPGLCNDREIY
jgi:ribosomal protein S6--L-glutamate ligase